MKEVLLGWKLVPLLVVSAGVFTAAGSGVATLVAEAPIVSAAPVPELLGLGKTGTALGVLAALVGLGLHYQDRSADRIAKGELQRDEVIGKALEKFGDRAEVSAEAGRDSVRRLHQKTEESHGRIREESARQFDKLSRDVVGGLSEVRVAIEKAFLRGRSD